MGDTRLREMERRWRESGATADEAAFLRERVRAGEVDPARLLLLAHCGHPAARVAAGVSAPAPMDLIGFASGLAPWGREACARAARAMALAALAATRADPPGAPGARAAAEAALGTLEAWLLCPCEEHAVEARRSGAAAMAAARSTSERTGAAAPVGFAAGAAILVLEAAEPGPGETRGGPAYWAGEAARFAAVALGDEAARTQALVAARADLMEWALGD